MSFTANYVGRDWTLTTPVLSTVLLAERHMQMVIAEHLGNVAEQWNIDPKISACVSCMHDDAANVKDVGHRNSWSDVTCVAHKLQLCVQSSMGTDKVTNNPIAECVAAVSRLVGHFAHSPMATAELNKRQVSMSPDSAAKKLVQQCKTSWNSINDMFERLVELRWPVCAVLSDRNVVKPADARTLVLKDEHWQMMADLQPVLKSLQIATAVLSVENMPDVVALVSDAAWSGGRPPEGEGQRR